MWTAFSEISEAIKTLQLNSQEIAEVEAYEADLLIKDIKEIFLGGKNPSFWWEHYLEAESYNPDIPGYQLLDKLSPDKEVYFIPHEEKETKVYLSNPETITKVLGECAAFEYSIVGKKLDWIITENHHDTIVVVGEKAKSLLKI